MPKWKTKSQKGITGWTLLVIAVGFCELSFLSLVSMGVIQIESNLWYYVALLGMGIAGSILAYLLSFSLMRQGAKRERAKTHW